MVKPFKPTIIYPNGGEAILTNSIDIQWNNSFSSDKELTFTMVGDFGSGTGSAIAVANAIKAQKTNFIVTTGDNIYGFVSATVPQFDNRIGALYYPYIKYPTGSTSAYASSGSPTRRFFPTIGNHDLDAGLTQYQSYFDLPGNEEYYTFSMGSIDFFILDSDPRVVDGRTWGVSPQALWFASAIASSKARWKIVAFHHPAYTSTASHAPTTTMQWPFKSLGVHAVFSGHNHFYERQYVTAPENNGLPYFVNGTGGQTLYTSISAVSPYRQKIITGTYGFMNITVTDELMYLEFKNISGVTLDSSTIYHPESINKTPKKTEIFYTTDYNITEESDWTQLASVPPENTSYTWRFGKNIKGDNCRVAVRTRGDGGEISDFSISAADFSIQHISLISPLLISPVEHGKYNKYVEIITDDLGVLDTFSQRSAYQFFYSSASLSIPKTAIAQDVAIGSGKIIWNTASLETAEDYVLQAYLEDDEGNVSNSTFIKNISITHDGDFIVDTTPPIASLTINNNRIFTTSREVNVNITAADETTGIHAIRLKEGLSEHQTDSTKNVSEPETNANIKRFVLSDINDVKTIQLLMQDYGANRNDESGIFQRVFQVMVELDNTTIADIAIDQDNTTLWAITKGTYKNLYKVTAFPALLGTFEDEPTSIAIFQTVIYISTKSSSLIGSIYKFIGDIELVKAFDTVDSFINTTIVHDDKLYIGMENGMIYSFDGLTFLLIDTVAGPAKQLFSDGSVLYLSQKNDLNVYAWDGSDFISTGQ